MAYEPSFTPTYPAWEELPSENTPARGSTFAGYDDVITNIETFLDGSTAVKPVEKTNAMTQAVGVASDGKLYTAPGGGGGGGGAAEDITYDNTQSGLTASDVQGAIDELAEGGGGGDYVLKTGDTMTGTLVASDIFIGTPVEGYSPGANSLVNGSGCIATGDYSHGEGANCKAWSGYSHAEGSGSEANAVGSHAEGGFTKTKGIGSHTEGFHTETTSNGSYSHVSGNYTKSQYSYQSICGKYNNNQSTSLFEVGNGTADNARSNAFEVHSSGNVKIGGEIDATAVTTMSNSDYVYVSVSGVIKKITISDLKTVLGI